MQTTHELMFEYDSRFFEELKKKQEIIQKPIIKQFKNTITSNKQFTSFIILTEDFMNFLKGDILLIVKDDEELKSYKYYHGIVADFPIDNSKNITSKDLHVIKIPLNITTIVTLEGIQFKKIPSILDTTSKRIKEL